MTVRTWFLCLCTLAASASLAHAAEPTDDALKPARPQKHDLSVGFLSHKTGLSILSYTHTLWSSEHQELYVGGGTLILLNTAACGWKGVLPTPFIDFYVVGAMLVMVGMSEHIIPAPLVSAGLELEFWDGLSLNAGVNNLVRVYFDDGAFHRRPDLVVFPQLSASARW